MHGKPSVLRPAPQFVRDQLTAYVLETQEDLIPYVGVLDGPRILEAIAKRD